MRLPYLQIANEVIDQAQDLAVLTDWNEAKAGWGMVKAISWALKRCPDDAPPSVNDVVRGPKAAKLIAQAFGYPGPPEKLVAGCEQLPHPILERVADGIRIRGLDRYNPAWGKSHPDLWPEWRERLKREADASPGQIRPEPAPEPALQTQTQTQTQEEPSPEEGEQAALELEPAPAGAETPEDLQQLWNAEADKGLPRWKEMPDARRTAAQARLRERPLGAWAQVIHTINATPFCLGQNERKWRANPDWLLKPGTAAKLLEGNFEGSPAPRPAQNRPDSGPPLLRNCAVCDQASEGGAIGEGIFACYPHVAAFQANAERNGWERPWEHAAEWVEAVRAQEVAA